ncbi:MAG: hypothetical protein Q8934_15450 [Bacillota bacterium]|nr:hypothetical protein [Bacillota bacterium]
MSKLYEINIEDNKKTLYVKASGFFKEEDALAYVNDFQAALKKISIPTFKLIVDATEQKAVAQDVVDEIKNVLNLYMGCGFKKIVVINPSSVVAKVQIQKCAKEMNFSGEFADNLEKAYSL